MSSSNKATGSCSGQKSNRCLEKDVNCQDENGRITENNERKIQGKGHRDHNPSAGQMRNISEHDTWGFEAMDKKPHYERGHEEANGLSLTASEEETARRSLRDEDKCSKFQGLTTLEDWQKKSYPHEQWWNIK